ncbi:MAG TPA: SurA N-terminal domain-containing protein, partial [Saprospiraceae bacterium]|nr:SurA N-terminal domain-containing protein [Saprospiraceae bacterium]
MVKFIAFLLSFSSVIVLNGQNLLDKVVATVGGEPILLSEIEQQYSYLKEGKAKVPESARCEILENMIVQNLLLNQAKLDSIVATDQEIDAEVNARIEEILRYMGNDESQFEDYYGKNVSEVRNQMHDPI